MTIGTVLLLVMCYYQYKFFLNLLDSNKTNIVKDTFITPTEDILKK